MRRAEETENLKADSHGLLKSLIGTFFGSHLHSPCSLQLIYTAVFVKMLNFQVLICRLLNNDYVGCQAYVGAMATCPLASESPVSPSLHLSFSFFQQYFQQTHFSPS